MHLEFKKNSTLSGGLQLYSVACGYLTAPVTFNGHPIISHIEWHLC